MMSTVKQKGRLSFPLFFGKMDRSSERKRENAESGAEASLRILEEMATFAEAGVSEKL